MLILTDNDIQTIGERARSEQSTIIGNCRTIAQRAQRIANMEWSIHLDIVETQVGERRDTHFVNKLSADNYALSVDGPVLIDAALDQFCTENQDHEDIRVDFGPRDRLPDVAIYHPGDEERGLWYYRPNDPREGYDVFTDEPLLD